MDDYILTHHGIKGQKWGVRRFQNPDGTRTAYGKRRYGSHLRKAADKTVDNVNAKSNYKLAKYDYKISKIKRDRKGEKTRILNERKAIEKDRKRMTELGRRELNNALDLIGQSRCNKELKKTPEYRKARDTVSEYRKISIYGIDKSTGLYRLGSKRNFQNTLERIFPRDQKIDQRV